jgi:hypothetical protein
MKRFVGNTLLLLLALPAMLLYLFVVLLAWLFDDGAPITMSLKERQHDNQNRL